MNCPNCNNKLEKSEMFCLSCGQFIDNENLAESPKKSYLTEKESEMLLHITDRELLGFEEKKQSSPNYVDKTREARIRLRNKKRRRALMIKKSGFAAIALILVFVVILSVFGQDGKNHDTKSFVYLKNDSLNFSPKENIEAITLPSDIQAPSGNVFSSLAISGDMKNLFYGTSTKELGFIGTKGEAAFEKIDSGVSSYYVDNKGAKIAYVKDNDFYLYTKKEAKVLAFDIYVWTMNEEVSEFLYWDYDENLYIQELNAKAKPSLIDSGVHEVFFISSDLKYILYDKGGSLMLYSGRSSSEKIASDISKIYAPSDGGEFYYSIDNTKSIKIKDYVLDDFALTDAEMTAPLEDDFKKEESYTDIWGEEQTRTVTDHRAYSAAQESYQGKLSRDKIRQQLDNEITAANNSLYYFNGSKSILVEEGFAEVKADRVAENRQMLVYTKQIPNESQKIDIGDAEDIEQIKTDVSALVEGTTQNILAIDGNAHLIAEGKEYTNFNISKTAEAVLYIKNYDYETNTGSLYKSDIKGKNLLESVRIADAVYSFSLLKINNNFVYFKTVSSSVGDMYAGDEKIASGVLLSSLISFEDKPESFVFIADYNADKDTGSLHSYDGKKLSKIDEAVSKVNLLTKGSNEIYYFKDYRAEEGRGDLHYSLNKKAEHIDYDVETFALIGQSSKLN